MDKNDAKFNALEKSMKTRIGNTVGQRYSNFLYRLQAHSGGLNANIMFSPQAEILVSRVLVADDKDLSDTKEDRMFVTDISGDTFAELNFNVSPDKSRTLRRIIMDLTTCVSDDKNWKTTVDYQKLLDILTDMHTDTLIRQLDTVWRKTHDLAEIVNTVVSSLGMDKAKQIIPQAYISTPLANLWYGSLEQLKLFLDRKKLNGSDMQKMNFGNQQKDLRRFEK